MCECGYACAYMCVLQGLNKGQPAAPSKAAAPKSDAKAQVTMGMRVWVEKKYGEFLNDSYEYK